MDIVFDRSPAALWQVRRLLRKRGTPHPMGPWAPPDDAQCDVGHHSGPPAPGPAGLTLLQNHGWPSYSVACLSYTPSSELALEISVAEGVVPAWPQNSA